MQLKNIIIEKSELIKIVWFLLKQESAKGLTKWTYKANKKNNDNLLKSIQSKISQEQKLIYKYNFQGFFNDIKIIIPKTFNDCEIVYIVNNAKKNGNKDKNHYTLNKNALKIYNKAFKIIKESFIKILKNENLLQIVTIESKIKTNIKKIIEAKKEEHLIWLNLNEFKKSFDV